MDYLEERQAVKTGSPYKKVFQVSLVLSSLVLLIFLFLEARHIRRVSIRHLLYYNIARLQEKGMDYEAIIEELSKRGWEPYRVNDAAHRYKKKYSGDKAQIPPHFSLDKNNPIFTVRRSLRRNYLYFLILKMAKKGMKIEEIKSNLMQKGWSEVHVSDAFHKYTKHIEKTEAEPVSFMNVSFLEKIGIYRHLRRNIRRLRLYYTMHKMLGKGMDFESISKELVGRGWKQRHIEDAVYRFREHLKR
jgi:phosphoribosyl-ATP pyrophosphohydrolase